MKKLEEYDNPKLNHWKDYYEDISRKYELKWLIAPWWFLEIYFYRRILDITGYYKKDSDSIYYYI